jgi:hypothetical protein
VRSLKQRNIAYLVQLEKSYQMLFFKFDYFQPIWRKSAETKTCTFPYFCQIAQGGTLDEVKKLLP